MNNIDNNKARSVLFVDDETTICDVAKRALSHGGYKVSVATSYEAAHDLLDNGGFDVIVSDYRLIGKNGIETILSAKEQYPLIGSVLITGVGNEETIIDAFTKGGVDYYLGKPFRVDQLRSAVALALKASDVRQMAESFTRELEKRVEEATSELREKNRLLEIKEEETTKLNEKLLVLSVTDELTGLYNYRHFSKRLAEEIERADRYNHNLSLIMTDIDDFKLVNDVYGHLAGDMVLKAVSGVIIQSSRKIDLPTRYGGEELAIILPEIDIDGASLRAERMREMIQNQLNHFNGKEIKVTVSTGVTSFNPSIKKPADLVESADKALYYAKKNGKNQVVVAGENGFTVVERENREE